MHAKGSTALPKISPSTPFTLEPLPQQKSASAALLRFRLMLEVRLGKITKARPGMLQVQKAFKGEHFMPTHYI